MSKRWMMDGATNSTSFLNVMLHPKSRLNLNLLFLILWKTRWIKTSLPNEPQLWGKHFNSNEQSPNGAGRHPEYLSLLAGWRFSSCFRLLLPGVAACAFRAQPPLCLLLPCSVSLLSASFSHIWQHVHNRLVNTLLGVYCVLYVLQTVSTNMAHLQYKPGFSLVLHPVFGESVSLLPVEAPNCQHHPSEDSVHTPPSSSTEHPWRQTHLPFSFIHVHTPTAEREA